MLGVDFILKKKTYTKLEYYFFFSALRGDAGAFYTTISCSIPVYRFYNSLRISPPNTAYIYIHI